MTDYGWIFAGVQLAFNSKWALLKSLKKKTFKFVNQVNFKTCKIQVCYLDFFKPHSKIAIKYLYKPPNEISIILPLMYIFATKIHI